MEFKQYKVQWCEGWGAGRGERDHQLGKCRMELDLRPLSLSQCWMRAVMVGLENQALQGKTQLKRLHELHPG